jgi:tetratricopeptide (TPR) repeat protein
MAREGATRSWLREIGITVTGSVLIFVIQNKLGLTTKPPDARLAQSPPAPPPDSRPSALRFYERALECARQGHYVQAVEDHTEALRIDPGLAAAYAGRGWAYLRQNDFRRAIQDYTEAIRHDPGAAPAYLNRAWAHLQVDDYEQAIRDCTEALRLDPGLTRAHEMRSWAYTQAPTPSRGLQ